jgi:hypothetical protein
MERRKMKYFWSYWKINKLAGLLSHGITLHIDLTYRCNLTCPRCKVTLAGKMKVVTPERTAEQWIEFLKTFPVEIREVYLSGGETTLFKGLDVLANWLLDQGIFVQLYSNLMKPEKIEKINPSRMFQIIAAYHGYAPGSIYDKAERFDGAYQRLKKRYQIVVLEYGQQRFPYSRLTEMFDTLELPIHYEPLFVVSPDFKIYKSCTEAYKGRLNQKPEEI